MKFLRNMSKELSVEKGFVTQKFHN